MTVDQILDVLPIGDRKPFKTELTPQDVGQHESVDVGGDAVHLPAVHHDRHGPRLDRLGKRRQENLAELPFRNVGGRAVFAAPRGAVPHVVLQRGRHRDRTFLKAADHGLAHVSHEFGVLAKGFPKPWPTGVTPHIEDRGEIPWNATCRDFLRRGLRHFSHERGVPRGRQRELLRSQGRT